MEPDYAHMDRDQPSERTDRDRTEVETELGKMPELLDDAYGCIKELEARLVTVLKQDETAKLSTLTETRPSMVPLAEQLADLNERTRGLAHYIRNINDRLEL